MRMIDDGSRSVNCLSSQDPSGFSALSLGNFQQGLEHRHREDISDLLSTGSLDTWVDE